MADSTSADSYRKPNSIEQREDYRRQPPSRSHSRSRSRSPPPRSSNNGSGRRRPSPRPRRRQSPEYTSRRREEQEDDRRYRDQQRSRNRDRDRDRDSYSYNRDRRDSRRDRDRSFRDGPPASSSSKPPVQEKESGPGGPSQGSIKQLKAPMAAVSMIEVEANDRLGGKVRVKCSPSDTIGDLKKLIAAQKGTKPEKIVLKKWYTIYKDHISLSDYEIHNGMSLEMH